MIEDLQVKVIPYTKTEDNKALQQIITSLPSKQGPSNIRAHATDWDVLFDYPQIKSLINFVSDQIIGNILRSYSLQKDDITCPEIWGVSYKKGDQTTAHSHLPSLFSFVYYVNVPDKSSPLYFNYSKETIEPQEGDCVIFDAALTHSVPVCECDDRCVVSGNFIWNKKGTGTYQ